MRQTGSFVSAAALVAVIALALHGCGDGGGSEGDGPNAAAPGSATVTAAGGRVASPDGVQVDIPAEAFSETVTVQIAKDSTGAPPLPAGLRAAGPVYAITPHGGDFKRHVEVTIPLPAEPAADNEQRVLVTAEAGSTRWTVLSGATMVGNALRAPVMHFSYFQIATLADIRVPTLALVMDRLSSVPQPGTTVISADYEFRYFPGSWEQPWFHTEARLTHTRPPLTLRGSTSTAAPRYCQPVDLGPAGLRLEVRHNGTIVAPGIGHWPTQAAAAASWPRNRLEATGDGFIASAPATYATRAGLGVAHFWGQDQPRAGAWVELGRDPHRVPPSYIDRYTLPPAGNAGFDDEWNWYGMLDLNVAHNGRIRIDASLSTDCGFDVAAVPLAFRMNVAGAGFFQTFPGVYPPNQDGGEGRGQSPPIERTAFAGEDVELVFTNVLHGAVWDAPETRNEYLQEVVSIVWETSSDGTTWRPAPELDPAVTVFARYFNDYLGDFGEFADHAVQRIYKMRFTGVMPGLSGQYRAYACIRISWDDPRNGNHTRTLSAVQCQGGRAYRLSVLTQPPTVTRQPASQAVLVGETASLAVAVQGTPRADLQWQRRSFGDAFLNLPWTNIPGATAATYTTPPLTLADHPTFYRVAYSNASGGGFTDAATVSVVAQLAPPVIQAQPGSLNVTVGSTAVFAATAEGAAPLSYQWRRNGTDVAGANAPILTLNNVTAANDGSYTLVVSNRAGTVTSEPATLVVTLGTPVALPPAIAQQPAALTVPAGSAANFAVAVTGTGPYSYVWMREGAVQPVSHEPILAFASVQAGDAGRYQVRVSNTVGTVLSAYAELGVGPASGTPVAPVIVTPPVAAAVLPGAQAVFAVGATGSGPLAFQWRRNGQDVAGATAAVLVLGAVTGNDGGQYSVEVRNDVGAASSAPVPLVVIGAPQIVTPPAAALVMEGATATFTVQASGDALRYQWLRNGVGLAGADASSYTTPALAPADNGALYSVIVYNGAGLVFSSGAPLTVQALIAPAVTTQPVSAAVNAGATATFSAAASGTPAPAVQWQRSIDGGATWVGISGATAQSYTTPATALADSGQQFRAVFSNGAGSVTSAAATLSVNAVVEAAAAPKLAAAFRHTCGVKADGNAACWGYNSSAQIGSGNLNSFASPFTWTLGEAVTSVATGESASCALTVSGRVFCSAMGFNGGLLTPQEKAGIGGATRIVLGSGHACVLAADRSVWCWGNNAVGQLGNGGGAGSAAPVQVQTAPGAALADVNSLAAGDNTTCAIRGDSSVWCWGHNNLLQAGSPAGADTTRAAPVAGLTGVAQLALGQTHACARLAGGSVACWGDNSQAQFGNGATSNTPSSTPTAVPGLSGVAGLASGTRHLCALITGGSVRCWGTASMGNGNVSEIRLLPVTVSGLGSVVALAAGFEHTCVLRASGSLACWGANSQGQLGLGDFITRTTPSDVPLVTFALP